MRPLEEDIFKYFKDEAREHLDNLNSLFVRIGSEAEDSKDAIHSLFRTAHTLKGAAYLVRQGEIGRIAHSMEDCLAVFDKNPDSVSPAGTGILLKATGIIKDLLDTYPHRSPELLGKVERVTDELSRLASSLSDEERRREDRRKAERRAGEGRTPRRIAGQSVESLAARIDKTLAPIRMTGEKQQLPVPFYPGDENMRVRVQHLDNLMNISGEFLINRIDLENIRNMIKKVQKDYNAIYFQLNRCSNISQEPAVADRLSSSPQGRELLDMLVSIPATSLRKGIHRVFDDISRMEIHLNNLVNRLSGEVSQIRLLPAESMFDRIHLLVKELSQSLDRKVVLVTHGGATGVDRRILNEMIDILIHLIRNSIDHGIEPSHIRLKKGKSPEGRLTLVLRRVGNSLEVVCEDDGAGVNLVLVKKEAVRRGLFSKQEVEDMDQQELLHRVIMEPGFSTSRRVTGVSGRGFGMDAVKEKVESLKGDIHIETVRDRMTRVVIKVPLSVSTMDGLMVICSGQRFVFPMNLVKETVRISRQDILRRDNRHYIKKGKRLVNFVHLADILGMPKIFTPGRAVLAVMVGYRDRLFAIGVDSFVGAKNVVVKTLGDHLKKVECISGCTVLGDGRPVLILEVADIIRRTYTTAVSRPIFQEGEKPPLPVLVVDDSVTSRILEKSILEAEGYMVHVASSGEEALPMIARNRYGVMVFDIDMPGISGIELIGEARLVKKNSDTPAVIVSSRDDFDTIRRIYEAGARGFMNKGRFSHQEFVQMIKSMI